MKLRYIFTILIIGIILIYIFKFGCKIKEGFKIDNVEKRECQIHFNVESDRRRDIEKKLNSMNKNYQDEIDYFSEVKNKYDIKAANKTNLERVEGEKAEIKEKIEEMKKWRDKEDKLSKGLYWILVDGYPNNDTNYFKNKQVLDKGIISNINTIHFAFKNQAMIPRSHYGVEISGYFKPKYSGRYEFYTYSYDMSFMWLNDEMIINNGGNHGMRKRESGYRYLDAGNYYSYIVHFGESSGGDNLIVGYRNIDTTSVWSTNGKGYYYHKDKDGKYQKGLIWKLTKGYPEDNFQYRNNKMDYFGGKSAISTGYVTDIDSIDFVFNRPDRKTYGIQITGYFIPNRDGNYRFRTISDDMSFVWINDKMIINNKGVGSNRMKRYSSSYMSMMKGKAYKIVIQYGQNTNKNDLIFQYRYGREKWTTNGEDVYFNGMDTDYIKYDNMLKDLQGDLVEKELELKSLINNEAESDFNRMKKIYEDRFEKEFNYENENIDLYENQMNVRNHIKSLEDKNLLYLGDLEEARYDSRRQQHIPYKNADESIGSWEPCYDKDKKPIFLSFNNILSYII